MEEVGPTATTKDVKDNTAVENDTEVNTDALFMKDAMKLYMEMIVTSVALLAFDKKRRKLEGSLPVSCDVCPQYSETSVEIESLRQKRRSIEGFKAVEIDVFCMPLPKPELAYTSKDVFIAINDIRCEPTCMNISLGIKSRWATDIGVCEYAREVVAGKMGHPQACFKYKSETLRLPNRPTVQYRDTNYVVIPGDFDKEFERAFSLLFTSMKRPTTWPSSRTDAKKIFDDISNKIVPARLINYIPDRDPELIGDVEAHRADLWCSEKCVHANVPLIIRGENCWFILVEALLAGSPHAVPRISKATSITTS